MRNGSTCRSRSLLGKRLRTGKPSPTICVDPAWYTPSTPFVVITSVVIAPSSRLMGDLFSNFTVNRPTTHSSDQQSDRDPDDQHMIFRPFALLLSEPT